MGGNRSGPFRRGRSLSSLASGAIARSALATAVIAAGVEADLSSGERGAVEFAAVDSGEPGQRE